MKAVIANELFLKPTTMLFYFGQIAIDVTEELLFYIAFQVFTSLPLY